MLPTTIELTIMETVENEFRTDHPTDLDNELLSRRIHAFRLERQGLRGDRHETKKLKLESVLAELESEALRRGLHLR